MITLSVIHKMRANQYIILKVLGYPQNISNWYLLAKQERYSLNAAIVISNISAGNIDTETDWLRSYSCIHSVTYAQANVTISKPVRWRYVNNKSYFFIPGFSVLLLWCIQTFLHAVLPLSFLFIPINDS